MEKNHKSESFIIKEAENVIEEYIKNRKEIYESDIFREKYERLKILSIAMGIVSSLGILLSIIFWI